MDFQINLEAYLISLPQVYLSMLDQVYLLYKFKMQQMGGGHLQYYSIKHDLFLLNSYKSLSSFLYINIWMNFLFTNLSFDILLNSLLRLFIEKSSDAEGWGQISRKCNIP